MLVNILVRFRVLLIFLANAQGNSTTVAPTAALITNPLVSPQSFYLQDTTGRYSKLMLS